MEIYWEQVVENLLGSSGSIETRTATPKSKQHKKVNSKTAVDVKTSKSSIVGEAEDEKKKEREEKKVKFKNDLANVSMGLMNVSVTSDEGINTTVSSQASTFSSRSSTSISIPTEIRRPQNPLKTSWTFWYSAGNRKLSWKQNQVKISTVDTAEQFWLLISQLNPPGKIPAGYTFSVFKTGILPDWEDAPNIEGGRWMIPCRKSDGVEKFDSKWLDILFMLVGEQMDEESILINGVEACARNKGNRLEVWVKNANTREVVQIGRSIKSKLKCDSIERLTFSLHREDRGGIKGPRLAL